MKQKLKPTDPVKGNEPPLEYPEVEIARTLEEGLRLLEECEPLCEILGQDFVTAYMGVKRSEFETFNRVISSWEREHLLLNV